MVTIITNPREEEEGSVRRGGEVENKKNARNMSTPPAAAVKTLTTQEILDKSMRRALGGGLAGATAMFVNVGTLMWMRTTINYQLRHGGGTMDAFRFVRVESL